MSRHLSMSVSALARKFKFLSKVSQQEVSEGSQPDNNHQTPHGPLVASLCLRPQIYLGMKNYSYAEVLCTAGGLITE